jgi:hypothetical protein
VLVQQLASRFAVELRLQQAFPRRHGDIPNGAVLKISGNGDKPAWLFRRFKEDSFPTVAVNVDLLTTGVDLPEIGNIVVLRCVSSRILSDHKDELRAIKRGYGEAKRPEDHQEGLNAFVRDSGNELPALTTVLTKSLQLDCQDLHCSSPRGAGQHSNSCRSSGCRFSRARSVWHRADAAVAAAGVAADARAVRAGVRGQP